MKDSQSHSQYIKKTDFSRHKEMWGWDPMFKNTNEKGIHDGRELLKGKILKAQSHS